MEGSAEHNPNFFYELNLGELLDVNNGCNIHSREESGNFKFNMVPVPEGVIVHSP
jgi:hypothetical protein